MLGRQPENECLIGEGWESTAFAGSLSMCDTQFFTSLFWEVVSEKAQVMMLGGFKD